MVNEDFGFHSQQKGNKHLEDPVLLRAWFLVLALPAVVPTELMKTQDRSSQCKHLYLLKKIYGLEKQDEARSISVISSACPTGRTGRSLRLLFALGK